MRAAALALAVLFSASAASAADDTVRIGLVAPLTGDQAYIGVGLLNGARMAVEDANVKGPVFGESKLELVPLDDQHNPTQAVLAANKLSADPDTLAVMGHFNSSCTKAASAIYHEARLAQVSPASTNPEISRQGFDTFHRVCPTDDVQGPAAAWFAAKMGAKNIVILDDQTTYGKGLAAQFQKAFEAAGGNVIARHGVTQGDKDFTPLLTKVKAAKPDLVFFGGVYPEMALLLRQSKKVGLETKWLSGDGIVDPSLAKLAGPAGEGVHATMLGVDPKSLPAAQDFVKRYEARHGEIGSFSAYGYDATNVLIDAIRRAGKKDREAVLKALKETKDFPGILGPVNFDEKGDAVGKSVGIFRIEDGKFTFVQEVKPSDVQAAA